MQAGGGGEAQQRPIEGEGGLLGQGGTTPCRRQTKHRGGGRRGVPPAAASCSAINTPAASRLPLPGSRPSRLPAGSEGPGCSRQGGANQGEGAAEPLSWISGCLGVLRPCWKHQCYLHAPSPSRPAPSFKRARPHLPPSGYRIPPGDPAAAAGVQGGRQGMGTGPGGLLFSLAPSRPTP